MNEDDQKGIIYIASDEIQSILTHFFIHFFHRDIQNFITHEVEIKIKIVFVISYKFIKNFKNSSSKKKLLDSALLSLVYDGYVKERTAT